MSKTHAQHLKGKAFINQKKLYCKEKKKKSRILLNSYRIHIFRYNILNAFRKKKKNGKKNIFKHR